MKIKMFRFITRFFRPKPKRSNGDGWLYLIHIKGNQYKVGCTTNITSRIKAYKTHNMNTKDIEPRITSFKVVECRLLEKVLHRYFKARKIEADSNEVYRLNDGDINDINNIIARWATW